MKELSVELTVDSQKPLYEQIYEALKKEILKGGIQEGERLPSTRFFSGYLEVSRSTVELAYAQLLSEGYIRSEAYRGYFVCDIRNIYDLGTSGETSAQEVICSQKEEPVYRYDFSPSSVDMSVFPYKIWSGITRGLLLDQGEKLFQSGDPAGDRSLREVIANYLHRVRGVQCTPDQIIVGAGNEYLQMLLAQILGSSRMIAMETPTYLPAWHTFCNLGYEIFPIKPDESGLDVRLLESSAADTVYVMPSHQFPAGIVMPMKRRLQLLGWAMDKPERYIIEDDYDSEFRYLGKPIPSLQSSDRGGRVIYLGTFSRSIAPAMRVSYMVLPVHLLEQYKKKCGFYSSTVSRILQNTISEFILQGYFERNLNKMRRIYRKRHEILLEQLKNCSWCGKIRGEHSGLHLLAEVRSDMSEQKIIEKCKAHDVRVQGVSGYEIGEKDPGYCPVLILGYGGLKEKDIAGGIDIITHVIMEKDMEKAPGGR